MITREEVQHIAKLARLGLSEKEIEKLQGDLSSILGYAEKLKEVDIKDVEPTSHSLTVENVFREDIEKPANEERKEKLLEMAPEKKNKHFKVKAVF